MTLMKKQLSLWFCLGVFLFQAPLMALVPGPILLSEDALQSLQSQREQGLSLATARSRSLCLKIAEKRFCPGVASHKAEALQQALPQESAKRVLLYTQKNQVEAIAVFFPTAVEIPAPSPDLPPLTWGPEPLPLQTARKALGGIPSPMAFAEVFQTQAVAFQDLQIWYDAEQHLGLITHTTATGEFVIGVFVAR